MTNAVFLHDSRDHLDLSAYLERMGLTVTSQQAQARSISQGSRLRPLGDLNTAHLHLKKWAKGGFSVEIASKFEEKEEQGHSALPSYFFQLNRASNKNARMPKSMKCESAAGKFYAILDPFN